MEQKVKMPKVVWKTPAEMGWTIVSAYPDYKCEVWVDREGNKHIVPNYQNIKATMECDDE